MAMSEYVRELRRRAGDMRLLLPSASVLVWNEHGELLMVKDLETGLWQTVGGAVDPGENPRDAAIREASEETGIEIELLGIRGVTGGPEFEHTYPNGHMVQFVGVTFDARPVGGSLKATGDNDETSAAQWWLVSELEHAAMTDLTRALLTQMNVFPAQGSLGHSLRS